MRYCRTAVSYLGLMLAGKAAFGLLHLVCGMCLWSSSMVLYISVDKADTKLGEL